jgi:hypothetical protein
MPVKNAVWDRLVACIYLLFVLIYHICKEYTKLNIGSEGREQKKIDVFLFLIPVFDRSKNSYEKILE